MRKGIMSMNRKKLILVAAGIIYSVLLSGCGSSDMQVNIHDGHVETILDARPGLTVGQLLDDAEIELESADEVEPAMDEIISDGGIDINIKRHAKVSVNVENNEGVSVELMGGTVADALESAGIELSEHDYVNHDMGAYLSDGMNINVTRRLEITLTVDGETKKVLTEAKNVEELLAEQEITLGDIDRITPKKTDTLSEGTNVVIKRVEKMELVETEPVEFETVTTYSNSMEQGTSRVSKQGENGEKKVTYEVTYVDGREESREAVKEDIIKEPVNQEVVVGSKPKGKAIVSKQAIYDCDGSGHGYYIITYSDGSVEYKDF